MRWLENSEAADGSLEAASLNGGRAARSLHPANRRRADGGRAAAASKPAIGMQVGSYDRADGPVVEVIGVRTAPRHNPCGLVLRRMLSLSEATDRGENDSLSPAATRYPEALGRWEVPVGRRGRPVIQESTMVANSDYDPG